MDDKHIMVDKARGNSLHEEDGEKPDMIHAEVLKEPEMMAGAYEAENREHQQGLWNGIKENPMACFWAFVMCFTIVMESFCMFLNGSWVALPYFKEQYGVEVGPDAAGVMQYAIPTKWQSSLFQAGQCGAFVGVLIAGPVTNKLGYRWTTLLALAMMTATIFITFFANSLEVLVIGQAFEGVPWGFFIANSPAYASEIVPLVLRSACAASLQMSWAIGSIIVAGISFAYSNRLDEWSWRAPAALQWLFPVPLMVLIFFAPESPWWLARRGRKEEAMRSIGRLGCKNEAEAAEKFAMMERTIEIEAHLGGNPSILELWKGTDLRRTLITCLVYMSQNFAGNLIANQATFFFERAGMSTDFSFKLGLINSCLQLVATMCSIPLANVAGRRTIFLYGAAINFTFLILLGICATISQNNGTNYAQAVFGILISFVYAGTLGPIAYSIISETSSVRLRALSTGVGRGAYYVAEIPMIYLASQMLNPTGWNLAGKCGYVWGGTAAICFIGAYFGLPELKGRSYRELDILFNRKVAARKFKKTVIDVKDNH